MKITDDDCIVGRNSNGSSRYSIYRTIQIYSGKEHTFDKSMHENDFRTMDRRLRVRNYGFASTYLSDTSVHRRIFFRTFRLFDTEGIASHKDSWDLIDFKNLILRQIAKARRDLYKFWYTGIQDIYLEVK